MRNKDQLQNLIYKIFDYKTKSRYRKRIKKRLSSKNCQQLTKEEKKRISKLFLSFGIKNFNTDWHTYYSCLNNNFSEKYIPEDLFYSKLEPALNDRSKFPVLADKNLLSKLFPQINQPETIIKNINGIFLSKKDEIVSFESAIKIIADHSEFIIKPSIDSGGGKKVLLISNDSKSTSKKERIGKVLKQYKKDFIVQEILTQHPILKQLNPTSINSIRVMSYLENNQVKVLSSYIRMGRKGAFADNISKGGMFCGIDKDGQLDKKAWDLDFAIHKDNGNQVKFESIKIPIYDQIVNKVCELHQTIPYFRLVSWDISVDALNNITLIELNLFFQEINAHQVINGPILFNCFKSVRKTI